MKDYQQTLELATLYAVSKGGLSGSEQLKPNIEVVGGSVDIYGSQEEPVSPPTGMFKTREAFAGIEAFDVIPNYLYIAQNTGTTTSIITSGLNVKEVE
jgi:hypothetical protein